VVIGEVRLDGSHPVGLGSREERHDDGDGAKDIG